MDENQEKPKYRNFSSFKKRAHVLKEFNKKFKKEQFLGSIEYKANEYFLEQINRNFNRPGVFGSEYSACEAIIYPILAEISAENNLPIWSHYKLESPEVNMTGEPDYLFADSEIGDDEYDKAIVCVGEAKKEKFDDAWGQVSAEMIAAQKLNKKDEVPIFGIVTTGKIWEFAKLQDDTFTYHSLEYAVPDRIDAVMNLLNWVFCEARKNADILEELDNK